ncbi:MAG: glycosyltransferase [Parcubacteria group bacterium]|nr:glycosyltransferase [Parcubacteria group bacterium]
MEVDKKRLLFVITQGVVGGAQKYVFDLAKNFKDEYQVSVACGGSADGDLFQKLAAEKITTHHLEFLCRELRIGNDIGVFFELLKLFRKEKPDIIHLNSSKVGVLGALAAFFYKLTTNNYKSKTIFTAHGWIFKESMPSWKKKLTVLLEWKAAWFKDRIICVSQDDFNQALHHKIAPARKLYVVHNAVEVKFVPREKAGDEIAKIIGRQLPEGIRLVNMGRLYANKDLARLVEEVSIIKNKLIDKNISLVIFGDGPERQRIEPRIKELNLGDNVFLTGDIPNASQYLKTFDFLVLSSIKEGLPYSVLEAALAGLRIVSTEVGGVREIVGDDGLLAKPKAKGELAELVLNDLDEDNNKVQARIERLKKLVVKNFNFETMVQKTEWVYRV